MHTNKPAPPLKPFTGTVVWVADDVCELDLGPLGRGRLKQQYSAAGRSQPSVEHGEPQQAEQPLAARDPYQKGKTLQVVPYREHRDNAGRPFWLVHERWAEDNPWPNLEARLPADRVVTGTVITRAPDGWFVALDQPDIEVSLPTRQIPWADGSTGDEHGWAGMARLALGNGDRIQAVLVTIRRPPDYPAISINALLDRRSRTMASPTELRHQSKDPDYQLIHRVRADEEALRALLEQLRRPEPLKGRRLIVIDDDQAALDALADTLHLNGAEVEAILEHDYAGLGDLANAAAARLTDHDLVLIDYSLPHQGEGLTVARRLRASRPDALIALFTGDLVEIRHQDVEQILVGVLRKPVRLDSLLRCLAGESVWEVEGLAPLDVHPPRPDQVGETPGSLLRTLFARKRGLRYLVLLRPLSAEQLAIEQVEGRFATATDLDGLIHVTGLSGLLKGYHREFVIAGEHAANADLRRYAPDALFRALGDGTPPAIPGQKYNIQKQQLIACTRVLHMNLYTSAVMTNNIMSNSFNKYCRNE